MKIPKGKLLIIGGAEDKGDHKLVMEGRNYEFEHLEILKQLFVDGKHNRIVVINTASEIPEEINDMYKGVLRKIGFEHVHFISIEDRVDARKKACLETVKKATAVLFSGGNQFRITTILGGTEVIKVIREKYLNEKDFIIAGTSAGAMALPFIMISEGGVDEALIDKNVKTCSGLGLLERCIIDTHFIKRGRFGRLAHAVVINPGQLGIGLGEDTALTIKNGRDAECHGSGMVVVIDGENIEQTNISEAETGVPIFVENLKVHILAKGCRFSLSKRRLAIPAVAPNKRKL